MKQLILTLATTLVLFACNNKPDPGVAAQNARQAVIDSMKAVDSVNAVKKAHHEHNSAAVQNSEGGGGGGTSTAATTTTTTPAKKKGWSHTAKGAVVGAGAGAITGALINKDHLKGAAIGTVVGAGAGAGIGAIVDHQKKKKEAAAANQ
jgi:hypothetical protein